MNALLDHVWRKSVAMDAIWARVAGMAPSRAIRKPIMILNLKAHMDESYSQMEFIIGGYIAPAESWAKFSGEWEQCLPCATRGTEGILRFHMAEMTTPERMKRVPLFYKVIEENGLIPIAARMETQAFERARDRVKDRCVAIDPAWRWDALAWPGLDEIRPEMSHLGPFDKPYLFLFRALMEQFHKSRENFSCIPKNERIDFIFDKGTGQENFIKRFWPYFIANQPEEVQELYGKTPDFADDLEVVALQAADFWAWWVRKWYEEDAPEPPDIPEKMKRLKFDGWQGKPDIPMIMVVATEDFIFDTLYGACLSELISHRSQGR